MKRIIMIIFIFILTSMIYGCDFISINTTVSTGDDPTTQVTTEEDGINVSYALNPGYDTLLVDDVWEDAGLVIYVNDQSFTVYSEDSVDTSTPANIRVTYSYENEDVSVQVIRYVSVIEIDDIVLELNPGIDTIYKGQLWVDAGATSNTSHEILIDNNVNNQVPGLYQVTYYIEDEYGILAQIIRYVRVLGLDDLN